MKFCSIFVPFLVHFWSIFGPFLVMFWSIFDEIFSPFLVKFWSIFDEILVNFSVISMWNFGPFVGRLTVLCTVVNWNIWEDVTWPVNHRLSFVKWR